LKSCLVTGSSGLIGQEICRTFLAQGYKVYGLDLKPAADLDSDDFTFIKCDVSSEAMVKKAFSKIKSLDVLVNNAAISNPKNKRFQTLSLKTWNSNLAVNLTSVFLLSRSSIPLLKKSHGTIINISSTRHKMSEADTEIYSASKGAMDALNRSMAVSLSHEVRVNSISPGWIGNPTKKLKKSDGDQHPAGRVGKPSDIAQMALYLASDKAGFITGQDFVVDGGMTVKMIYKD
jgi:NAD(P)-dependent dehydrogenase (short-subunit alcohol dehydrogenase family)